MPKGNRRPVAAMAQGAIAQQKDAEIESLKEQLNQLKVNDATQNLANESSVEIPVNQIVPLRIESRDGKLGLIRQPRIYFDPEGIDDLANSIRENGLREPVVVRVLADGKYGLLDGERRWRSHIAIEREMIRATVVEASDHEALEWAITTDSLKEKVSPLEQTISVMNLLRLRLDMDEKAVRSTLHALNNYDIGNSSSVDADDETIGVIHKVLNSLGIKLGSLVARLPLLDLPDYIRTAVNDGKISPTNALLINRTPTELHQRLLQEGAELSKTNLKKLILQLKAELSSTEASVDKQRTVFLEDSISLPDLVGDRWSRIKRSRLVKAGGDGRLNRKLKKLDMLLQEIEAYISKKES